MIRIAIYTAIFGGKDRLLDPKNYTKCNNIAYFCFSENDFVRSDIYKVNIIQSGFVNPSLNSRCFKILCESMFQDYDYVIWHDGNIQIDHSRIYDLVQTSSRHFLTTFKHPHRSCFYEEACICIKRNKDNPLKILKQVISYYNLGLPSSSGLFETGIVVKNNSFKYNSFYSDWWSHILKYSKRDQLSLCFLVWRENMVLGILPGSGTKNVFSVYHPHRITEKSWNRCIKLLFIKIILVIRPKT